MAMLIWTVMNSVCATWPVRATDENVRKKTSIHFCTTLSQKIARRLCRFVCV